MNKKEKYDIKIVSIMPKEQERVYEMLKEIIFGCNNKEINNTWLK